MKALAVLSALCLAAFLAWSGAAARAVSDPPIVDIGPLGGGGTAPMSGSVGSGGDANACVNSQHSGATPTSSPSGAGNVVQVADRSCSSAGPTDGAGQAGSPQASQRRSSAGTRPSGTAASGGAAHAGAVTAANAIGLRIASIRIDRRSFAKARRLKLVVTIRDLRKRVVRYGVIALGCPRSARGIPGCRQSTFSNRLGQASFQLRLGATASGQRLTLAVTARTPKAQVRKLVTLRLPRLTTRTGR